jgi:glucosylceramidase
MRKNGGVMQKFIVISTVLLSILALLLATIINSCSPGNNEKNYHLTSTREVWLTSEAGDKLAQKGNFTFSTGNAAGNQIRVNPAQVKQTIDGIGTSFTESSAFVLAHLTPEKRLEVLQQIFGETGANFSLTRTHIGACDFSVKGNYSYADQKGDAQLASFSLAPDTEGFDPAEYPGVKDPGYDLLPMIKEALAIKNNQRDQELRIISSAWTAPWWMKDIEDWHIPGSPANNWQGTGGALKPEYVSTYADYLLKYLAAYAAAGVKIWGITPVNEPHGNGGQWESMNFTPESQNEFVKHQLGPKLRAANRADLKLLIYDQNRDGVQRWTDVLFADPETAPFIYGVAVHWYESTHKVYETTFDSIHQKFPDFAILHTEGCIDDLGKAAPGGVADPARYTESGWFNHDAFWWNANATDWAYTVPWSGVKVADHPLYTPVHRYARNIIVSLDHWMTGWIDWNIVLDQNGGPNHVGNFCGAPIMIDTQTQQVYFTPIFYVLAQLSRTIRPGDRAVATTKTLAGLETDALHACATINSANILSVQVLNTTKNPIEYQLQIGQQHADVTIPANSVQTVRVQL